ncbi:MAG TPA: hypothetical protein VGR42_04730 [Casimicrobiaceae bacterium]|nr:hypothetical protein [Casimicrobiaceae bacterium]
MSDAARANAALIERFYSALPVRSSIRARAAKGLAAYIAANP